MRMHPNAIRALSFAAALSLCAKPQPEEEMTDEERKTPPPELKAKSYADRYMSLPGETNRQFAARMKSLRGRDV